VPLDAPEHVPFSLLCGAIAVYAASAGRTGRSAVLRLGIGVCAVSFALDQVAYLR
jgi:hypothetical protein